MVGALADWFAVTALFRHPLGVPIPHTAIIPRRKEEIGRSLGEFVQGNFLTREVLEGAARRRRTSAGGSVRGWPSRDHADGRRRRSPMPCGARSRCSTTGTCRRPSAGCVVRRLRRRRVAPLLGKALDVSVEGGHHQRLLDAVLKGLARSSTRTAPRCGSSSTAGVAVVGPRADRRPRVQQDLQRRAALPRRRASPSPSTRCASRSTCASGSSPTRLRTDPVLIAKGEELKPELLSHPDVQAWLQSLWGGAEAGDADGRRRSGQRAAPAPRRRARPARASGCRRPRAAGQGRRLGGARRGVRRRALPRRGRRPHRHDGRALGRPPTRRDGSNCRSAATCSSSASTARWSGASPGWPSTPSARACSDVRTTLELDGRHASAPASARLAISLLDLTDLGDDTDEAAADVLCARATSAGVAAVCVWPRFVARCAGQLDGTGVRVATVVNFPSGDDPPDRAARSRRPRSPPAPTRSTSSCPYRAWLAGDDGSAATLLEHRADRDGPAAA